jgi:hypothetical protein
MLVYDSTLNVEYSYGANIIAIHTFQLQNRQGMFRTLGLQAGNVQPPFDFANNPYKAKKSWPPNFKGLSNREQFRLEKRYRSRTKLKWARPTWSRATKVVQIGVITCQSAPQIEERFWTDIYSCHGLRSIIPRLEPG